MFGSANSGSPGVALAAMDLTIVGCSGSFPGPDGPASCYLVTADGFRLIIDLGNGAFGGLQRFADPAGVDAVLISHLHADHCLDMCAYQVFRTFHPSGPLPPIPVYGPAGTADRLGRAAGADTGQSLSDRFDFVTLEAGAHAARAGAGRLVLTHLMPWTSRDVALAEASAVYRGAVSLAEPGQVL